MKPFLYPFPPELCEPLQFLSNSDVLLAYGHQHYESSYIYVLNRFTNTWQYRLHVPCGELQTIALLLGFQDRRTFSVLLHSIDYVRGRTELEVVVLEASEFYDEVFVAERSVILRIDAAEEHKLQAFAKPITGSLGFGSWKLARLCTDRVQLYEVDGTEAHLVASVDLPSCCFATIYGTRLFLVCRERCGYNRERRILRDKLYFYDTESRELQEVPNFASPARLEVEFDDIVYYSFRDHINWKDEGRLYGFDMDWYWQRVMDSCHCHSVLSVHSDNHHCLSLLQPSGILPSGELLTCLPIGAVGDEDRRHVGESFLYDGIRSTWLEPPSLRELAIRAIHGYLPDRTVTRLHESDVRGAHELVRFILRGPNNKTS